MVVSCDDSIHVCTYSMRSLIRCNHFGRFVLKNLICGKENKYENVSLILCAY